MSVSVAKTTAAIIGGGGALTGASVEGYKYLSSRANCKDNECKEKNGSEAKEEGLKEARNLSSLENQPETADRKASPAKEVEPSEKDISKQ